MNLLASHTRNYSHLLRTVFVLVISKCLVTVLLVVSYSNPRLYCTKSQDDRFYMMGLRASIETIYRNSTQNQDIRVFMVYATFFLV